MTALSNDEFSQALRRHLEDRERLLYTSRSVAVSEMASTLAHELNQPIGTVANILHGLKARLEAAIGGPHGAQESRLTDPANLLSGVQLALDQALFASRVITRIRDYSHSRQPRRDLLDLVAVVRDSLALMDWELVRNSVELHCDMPAQPCHVVGDQVLLQQMFVNLLRNAIEAMQYESAQARRLEVRLRLGRQSHEAEVLIRDNGCGLPLDAEERLFVPFQSTKPNGMGIGLNICRSFAEIHQGRLWFSRNALNDGGQGRGATFHVTLPLSADAPKPTLVQ